MKCAGWDSSKLFDMVDWEARARAGKTIKGEQRTTIFKLEFDLFATMKRRRQFEKLNNGRCPRCGKFNEDFDHTVRCPHNNQERIKIWTKLMAPLRGVSTCPYVIKTFDKGLQKWLATGTVRWEGKIPNRDDEIGQATFQAFLNQQAIGWNQAIRGRISHRWGIANSLESQTRCTV